MNNRVLNRNLAKIMTSNRFNRGEKNLIEYDSSNGTCSNFTTKLCELLFACDENNLYKMSFSFPEHVKALRDRRNGAMGKKIEDFIAEGSE